MTFPMRSFQGIHVPSLWIRGDSKRACSEHVPEYLVVRSVASMEDGTWPATPKRYETRAQRVMLTELLVVSSN